MDKDVKNRIKNLLAEIKENKDKKITVYAIKGCPACEELKQKLNNVGVLYESVPMNDNDDMWSELEARGGSDYVPQVEVEGNLITEYETVNELVSETISLMIDRKVILK